MNINICGNKSIIINTVTSFIFKKSLSHSSKVHSPTSLANLVLKKEFDKFVQDVDNDSSKKYIIQKRIVDNIDAKKSIESDLARIEPAQEAVVKISNNETPSKKEFTAYSYLRNQYEEHLEDDSDSDSNSESKSEFGLYDYPKQDKHKKLEDLKTYLKTEYKANAISLNRLKKKFSKLPDLEKQVAKRKIEDSGGENFSKKTHQSVHDFVEDLPKDYNPLDDNFTD